MKQKTPSSRKTSQTSRSKLIKSGNKELSSASKQSLAPDKVLSEEDSDDTSPDSLQGGSNEGDIELEDPSESEIASSIPTSDSSLETEIVVSTHNDPLKRYMEEVRRYRLLELEEETSLAIRLKDHGDLDAAKTLVTANLRLVVKIAFEYRTFYSNLLDLIQEGNIGLMKAVSKFDPTKGARLGYYASWWIRSYILKYLLDNFRLVKVGTTQAQKKLFYHLMREKEKLEAQGLLAGPKLLAERLNVREKDVTEMEQRLSGRGAEMSLEAPVDPGEEDTTTHKDLLVDNQEQADTRLAHEELLQILHGRLPAFQKTLNDKERRILNDRLLSEEPKTLQEVADLYGLTRERARQIESKVIEKLREFLSPILSE